jgi:hypothetical protein
VVAAYLAGGNGMGWHADAGTDAAITPRDGLFFS